MVDKKPLSQGEILGLLKISRDNLIDLRKMFSDVIHSKDFDGEYDIVTAFTYTDEAAEGGFDAFTDAQFDDAIKDESEIVKVVFMAYPKSQLGRAYVNGIDIDKEVPAKLKLSENDATVSIRLLFHGEINADDKQIQSCNRQLKDFKEKVTKYLNGRQRFSNRFIGFWGAILAYVFAGVLFAIGYFQQNGKPVDGVENFLLMLTSLIIGFFGWFLWFYYTKTHTYVVFLTNKPGLFSRIKDYYNRNKTFWDMLIVGIILAIIAWALGLIKITI